MIKKRWFKHLLTGLCLLMAIPAFAQEKYWIRVSEYSDLLTRAIDSVSNLCKQNSTYGSYATGEYTYPVTLPRVGIAVRCSMEHPNPSLEAFGMDVYCPKGTSHRLLDPEIGLEEGCWSQMTCEQAAEQGFQRPEECCTPQPIPANGNLCPAEAPIGENGYPFAGAVACSGQIRQPCVWKAYNINPRDPQAEAFINYSILIHETFHQNDGTLICIQGGKYASLVGGGNKADAALSEVNASETQLIYLEEIKKECCTSLCRLEIENYQEFISEYKEVNARKYCMMSITGISPQIDCSVYTEE